MGIYTGTGSVAADTLNPNILVEAVQGAFAQKNAFFGSQLAALGIIVVNDTFDVADPQRIGKTVEVPYFGTVGEFVDNPDGSSLTFRALKQMSETGSVARQSLGVSLSRWSMGGGVGDVYAERARQMVESATRGMDRACTKVAVAPGVPTKDVYSLTSPVKLTYQLAVQAKLLWGDEGDNDRAGLLCHSYVKGDLAQLVDGTGRPILQASAAAGGPDSIYDLPIVTSDNDLLLTGSTMTSVVATGTAPNTLTLSGTPLGPWNLKIQAVTAGANGTGTFRFSVDGGNTWSAILTTAGDGVNPLIDTATDSLVGKNGATGLTATLTTGINNADNLYSSAAFLKCTSLLLKPGAMAYWFNRNALAIKTDEDIGDDSTLAAMHLYHVAHRYRRRNRGTRPGVIRVVHNASAIA
jgi:hypothetical protein